MNQGCNICFQCWTLLLPKDVCHIDVAHHRWECILCFACAWICKRHLLREWFCSWVFVCRLLHQRQCQMSQLSSLLMSRPWAHRVRGVWLLYGRFVIQQQVPDLCHFHKNRSFVVLLVATSFCCNRRSPNRWGFSTAASRKPPVTTSQSWGDDVKEVLPASSSPSRCNLQTVPPPYPPTEPSACSSASAPDATAPVPASRICRCQKGRWGGREMVQTGREEEPLSSQQQRNEPSVCLAWSSHISR